jgi:hypothetical protein
VDSKGRAVHFARDSSAGKSQSVGANNALTGTHTQAAQYAIIFLLARESRFLDSPTPGIRVEAFHIRASSQQHLKDHLSTLDDPRRIGSYLHPRSYRTTASRLELRPAVLRDLDSAKPARAIRTDALVVAKVGDFDARSGCSLQYGPALRGLELLAVDGQSHHVYVLCTAANLHTS